MLLASREIDDDGCETTSKEGGEYSVCSVVGVPSREIVISSITCRASPTDATSREPKKEDRAPPGSWRRRR